jgi:Domain of unknown function (DUF4190)/zinc-ribbon domain
MFCSQCGAQQPDNSRFCPACGAGAGTAGSTGSAPITGPGRQPATSPRPPVHKATGTTTQVRPSDSTLMRMLLPVGRSGWAIAAGYAGLFGVTVVLAPVALILGVYALVDLRRHPEKHGMGRTIFAIVVGLLGTGFLAYRVFIH